MVSILLQLVRRRAWWRASRAARADPVPVLKGD
jgi:hypothetical protein